MQAQALAPLAEGPAVLNMSVCGRLRDNAWPQLVGPDTQSGQDLPPELRPQRGQERALESGGFPDGQASTLSLCPPALLESSLVQKAPPGMLMVM